jgi:hypothetical protein
MAGFDQGGEMSRQEGISRLATVVRGIGSLIGGLGVLGGGAVFVFNVGGPGTRGEMLTLALLVAIPCVLIWAAAQALGWIIEGFAGE